MLNIENPYYGENLSKLNDIFAKFALEITNRNIELAQKQIDNVSDFYEVRDTSRSAQSKCIDFTSANLQNWGLYMQDTSNTVINAFKEISNVMLKKTQQ